MAITAILVKRMYQVYNNIVKYILQVLILCLSNGYANGGKKYTASLSRFIAIFAGDVQIDLE